MPARKLPYFIYSTIVSCTVSIVISGVSIGTEEWISGTALDATSSTSGLETNFNYGLFLGHKSRILAAGVTFDRDLRVVCASADGKCMMSCGASNDIRSEDLDYYINGGADNFDHLFCPSQFDDIESKSIRLKKSEFTQKPKKNGTLNNTKNDDKGDGTFLSFYLWLLTILSLCFGMIFKICALSFALLNSFRAPSQPIFSVFGLYIWNGCAFGCEFLVLILWGCAYGVNLKKNASISDTLSGDFTSEGGTNLGWSYWISLIPPLISIGNLAILKYRTWKIMKLMENDVRVMDSDLQSPDILLF